MVDGVPSTGDVQLQDELDLRRFEALAMGGPERVDRHHESGRLTARERIALLVDTGSWREIGLLALPEHRRDDPAPGDAIVTGFARIDGRMVCVVAIDATVLAGTTAPVNMRKQNRMAEWAGRRGIPLVFLSDSDGGRLPDLLGGASQASRSTSRPSSGPRRAVRPRRD
jgi:acetyl-CoA carboxylase carboxyltransferase component